MKRLFWIAVLLMLTDFSSAQWLNDYQSRVDLDNDAFTANPVQYKADGIDFLLGKGGVVSHVWGRGVESKGVYPDELLPALFSRKLLFDKVNFKDGDLLWIFTGPKAGFTLKLDQDSLVVVQRYYDSFGLHDESAVARNELPRFPDKSLLKAGIQIKGKLQSVAVTVSHDLKLTVFLNNKQILTQMIIMDVTRHQLKYTGKNGTIQGKLVEPLEGHETLIIHKDIKHQKILGFGGITSVVSYNELSKAGKERWWEFLKEYNLLIQREYPNGTQLKADFSNWDNFEDASVHYYGDNFPNGEISDFSYNKKIQDAGGMVIFEFWAFPQWMLDPERTRKSKSNKIPVIEKYTEAMLNYCQTAKRKTGMPPAIVGIQNERNQPADIWHAMTLALRKKLDDHGFQNVKIHMHNGSRLNAGIKAARTFSENEQVWNTIDYAATNMYDYQSFFTNPDGYDEYIHEWNDIIGDKPFLSTELCINKPPYQHGSYRLALTMGQLYHKNLQMMNAEAIIYCWTLLNGPQPTFDATRSLFRVDRLHDSVPAPSSNQLRVFGAFSRKLLKGIQRVDVDCPNKNLLTTAYTDQNNNTVLVILNKDSKAVKVRVEGMQTLFTRAEITDPFHENDAFEIQELLVDDNTVCIKGGQILTLYSE